MRMKSGELHHQTEHWAIAKTLWDERIYHIFHIKKVENEKRSQFKNINATKQRLARLLARG
jgi:hypothetical protein